MLLFSSTAKVISERRLINEVSRPGIEPRTLRFQDNHQEHYTPRRLQNNEWFFSAVWTLYVLKLLSRSDSDRGHSYKHLKKINLRWKMRPWHVFECSCVRWIFKLPEMAKKWNFEFFRPNLRELWLFHPYFVCKCSYREISMIKIVILDQSKPISLILKIKNLIIQKTEICKFHVYYS